MDLKQQINYFIKKFKDKKEITQDPRMGYLKDLVQNKQMLQEINKLENFDWEELILIFLKQPGLHKSLINYLYPDYEYQESIESLGEKYNYHYFINLQSSDEELKEKVSKIHGILIKDNITNNLSLGLLFPIINIPLDIRFKNIIFISPSVYNYFYKKMQELDIYAQLKTFKNLLQYMESNTIKGRKINDLHIDPINESQYKLTARLGEKNLPLTKEAILKEDIDRVLYEAKIKMGLETEENVPEVTGIAHESLIDINGNPIERNFRVNIVQDVKNFVPMYSVSIRKLMNTTEIINNGLNGLGYSVKAIELIKRITMKKYGINVVSGPTNSGKTTLLATILYDLYNQKKRIISIEDPVEISMPYTQLDLSLTANADEKYKMTRRKAMKAALRQDPDIVLIGEARDEEIPDFVELGVRGHTAYTTMHTGNITDVILRLLDGIENPVKVLNSVNGIITQMLYDKVCQTCHGSGNDKNGELCPSCQGSGIHGVIPIYEIAYFKNLEISRLLKEDGKIDLKKFFDFKTLIENDEMEYVSKVEVARELYKENKITKKTLEEIEATEKDVRGEKSDNNTNIDNFEFEEKITSNTNKEKIEDNKKDDDEEDFDFL